MRWIHKTVARLPVDVVRWPSLGRLLSQAAPSLSCSSLLCWSQLEFMMARLKKVEEYERELNQLRVQDAEEYNIIKIKLEHDVQVWSMRL